MRKLGLTIIAFLIFTAITIAQVSDPRVPAEWEEVQGVILCIDTIEYEYDEDAMEIRVDTAFIGTQCRVMKTAIEEGVDVYCFYGASVSPANDIQNRYGIPADDVHYIAYEKDPDIGLPDPDHNVTVWLRDTGPLSVYDNEIGPLYMGNWFDDQASRWFAEEVGYPKIDLREPGIDKIRFSYTDGGNFLTDGMGNMFIDSTGCSQASSYSEKINQIFREELGINNIVFIDPMIDIHVDYYLKLLNEETFVISSIPAENFTDIRTEIDETFKWKTQALKTLKAHIESLIAPSGRKYKVEEIPNAPTIDFFDFAGEKILEMNVPTVMCTYTNALILNHTVIVPQYTIPGHYDAQSCDEFAMNKYNELMPGYRVIGISAWQVATGHGSIHCLTRDVAAEDPVWIKHFWVDDTIASTDDIVIDATIKTQSGVKSAILYWKKSTDDTYNSLSMTDKGDSQYESAIPGHDKGTVINYYIEAESNSGKTITKPYVAPDGIYTYHIDNSGTATPSITVNTVNLEVFPNPATNTLYLSSSNTSLHNVAISIYNSQGIKVLEELYAGPINIAALSKGIYYLQLEQNGQIVTKKIIKQ